MKNHLTKIITIIVATLMVFVNCQVKDDVAKYKKLYEKAEASVNAELEAKEKHALEEDLRKKEEEKQGKEQEKKKQDEQAKREEQERKEKEEANKADQAKKDAEKKKQEEDSAVERDRKEQEQAEKDKAQKDAADQKAKEDEAEKAKQEEKERKEKEDAEKKRLADEAEKKRQQEEEAKQRKEQEEQQRRQQEEKEKQGREQEEQQRRQQEEEKERREQEKKQKEEAEKRRQQEEEKKKQDEAFDDDAVFLNQFEQLANPSKKSWVTMKLTGQYCRPCGLSIPSLINRKNDNKDNLVIVLMHAPRNLNGELYNRQAASYMNHIDKFHIIPGFPYELFNSLGKYKEERGLYDVIRSESYIKRMAKVERKNRTLDIKFIAKGINNDTDLKSKKLKLVIWITENKIIATQKIWVYKHDFEHNYVFRAYLSDFLGDEFRFEQVYKRTVQIPSPIEDNKIQDSQLVFLIMDSESGQIYDAYEYKLK